MAAKIIDINVQTVEPPWKTTLTILKLSFMPLFACLSEMPSLLTPFV